MSRRPWGGWPHALHPAAAAPADQEGLRTHRERDGAGTLSAKLHDHVLVAHFGEVDGVDLSLGSGVDTMPRPRVKRVKLCARHGVILDAGVAHTALGDTRALTRALQPAG